LPFLRFRRLASGLEELGRLFQHAPRRGKRAPAATDTTAPLGASLGAPLGAARLRALAVALPAFAIDDLIGLDRALGIAQGTVETADRILGRDAALQRWDGAAIAGIGAEHVTLLGLRGCEEEQRGQECRGETEEQAIERGHAALMAE